jgi:hypothetical protein
MTLSVVSNFDEHDYLSVAKLRFATRCFVRSNVRDHVHFNLSLNLLALEWSQGVSQVRAVRDGICMASHTVSELLAGIDSRHIPNKRDP